MAACRLSAVAVSRSYFLAMVRGFLTAVESFVAVFLSFPSGLASKESACNARDLGSSSLGWEDLLEKGKATHSSILAWRIKHPMPVDYAKLHISRVSTRKTVVIYSL